MLTVVTSPRLHRKGLSRRIAAWIGLTLLGAAIAQQLRRPKAERDWHGTVMGFVPYDLRRPTLARVKDSLWAPEDSRMFLPRAFGVGWSPNLVRIVHVLRRWRPEDE
ncbi:hypothetical protein [Aeromicrobium sp.]|uniref:hypothetical protein n=1 Tax=Aeromicrobium sp. TaxID=1871063 RepID=UPI002FC8E7A2